MPTNKNAIPMTKTGFCQYPSTEEEFNSHEYCQLREFTCDCECHHG